MDCGSFVLVHALRTVHWRPMAPAQTPNEGRRSVSNVARRASYPGSKSE
jgi:hypothetical protein